MFFINNYIKLIRLFSEPNFIGHRIGHLKRHGRGSSFGVESVPGKKKKKKKAALCKRWDWSCLEMFWGGWTFNPSHRRDQNHNHTHHSLRNHIKWGLDRMSSAPHKKNSLPTCVQKNLLSRSHSLQQIPRLFQVFLFSWNMFPKNAPASQNDSLFP